MTALRLRELTAEDLDDVARIEAAVSPDPWSRDLFAGELDVHEAERHWLVAEFDEPSPRLAGFGGMMYVVDDAHLMNLAVDPTAQSRGLGRRLLAALVIEAIDRGARALTLEVRVTNQRAIELYRGFRLMPVGARPNYYPDGEDALILWAHDIDEPAYRARIEAMSGEESDDARIR